MTMRKIFRIRFLFPIVCLLGANMAESQTNKTDSLLAVLKNAKEDTGKVNTLLVFCRQLELHSRYKSSDSVAKMALELSQKLNFKKGIGNAYLKIGNIYRNRHNDSEAIKNYMLALQIFREIDNKEGIGNTYGNLGNINLDRGNYSEAMDNDVKALKIFEETGIKQSAATEYQTIGNLYSNQGNYLEALNSHLQALKLFQEIENKEGVGTEYQNIGNVYDHQGNYFKALDNYLQALKIARELENKIGMGNAYTNIGNIYHDEGNNSEALNNYMQALKMGEEIGNKKLMGNAYGDLGLIYNDENNYPEALNNMLQALKMFQETGNTQGMSIAYVNLGNIYTSEGKYYEAMNNLQLALKIFRENGDIEDVGYAYTSMGKICMATKKYTIAQKYLDSALVLAESIGRKQLYQDTYLIYSDLDSTTGNFRKSLADYKSYIIYRDSLMNNEIDKKIMSQRMAFNFKQKQDSIKGEQERKDAITAGEKKKQTIITASVSIVLFLALIFTILLFNRFKLIQRQKKLIEMQKEEVEKQKTEVENKNLVIEEKNKDILDSITYAKRLQDAILPPLPLIKHFFPESFILYKPKDIVAGDFYWMAAPSAPDGGILIAACDCTGHGVPGAMVSVVCSNALNRAVKEFHISEPGKILDKTRELILETFSQSKSNENNIHPGISGNAEIKDGMDISLLSVSPQAIIWSGAYNSLWYTDGADIKEITGDKQPIGKTDNPKPFTTHTVHLSRPHTHSTFYLFTDGFADQFGGPKGKKFKYGQLKEKLLAISGKPMNEQKKILEKELEEWQGKLEQTDDICVIGVRV